MIAQLKSILENLFRLFYPRRCVLCAQALVEGEEHCCLHCIRQFPLTGYHLLPECETGTRLYGRIPVEKACSFLYYSKGGIGQRLTAEIKYRGNPALGKWTGKYMGREIAASGFFEGIDCLFPVPLHRRKLRKRGFNQSEQIAAGIAEATGIPLVTKGLSRLRHNPSQTRMIRFDRWINTRYIFKTDDKADFSNRHILLIDDVLTSGSTIEACARCLLESPGARVSVLTLCIAK